MAAYSHVVVVMSIVLGLAVTQLLKGVAQLYRTRRRIHVYWLHTAWIAFLAVFSLLLWWTYWHYRDIEEWTFFRFVLYLSPTVVFYFITAIAIPDPTEGVTDLREYYFANRAGFFGTFALYGVCAALAAVFVRELPILDPSNLFRVGMVLLCLLLVWSARELIHTIALAMAAVLMLAFIILFHFRLG
jgi:hypothetical protein